MSAPNLLFITTQGACYEIDADGQRVRWSQDLESLEEAEWFDLLWCKPPSIGHAWRFHADDGFDRQIRRVSGPIQEIRELH